MHDRHHQRIDRLRVRVDGGCDAGAPPVYYQLEPFLHIVTRVDGLRECPAGGVRPAVVARERASAHGTMAGRLLSRALSSSMTPMIRR
jgi:hypothetical protein